MTNMNYEYWLMEVGTGTDNATGIQGSVPQTNPYPEVLPAQQGPEPDITNPSQNFGPPQQNPPDVSTDPQVPDMPEEEKKEQDFNKWKSDFLKLSIKGDVDEMKLSLSNMRERELDEYPRKFVEDNIQIMVLREYSNVDVASKNIRKALKQEVDHQNPGTTLVNTMVGVLREQPLLSNWFIKCNALMGNKGDAFRKLTAALLGAVQVGSGVYGEDLIFVEKDYTINISTRMNSRFGFVHLDQWVLKQDDPERYLKPPELKRLTEDGSPEERIVLRHRVVMESIAESFKRRAFIITIVGQDGTIYFIGFDLGSALKAAYQEGRLVVRLQDEGIANQAMISDEGEIIKFVDMKINFISKTGGVDENGKAETEEVDFINMKYGQLYLAASQQIIKEAASSFSGLMLKEIPYTGNPADLKVLRRCIPSTLEMLSKIC